MNISMLQLSGTSDAFGRTVGWPSKRFALHFAQRQMHHRDRMSEITTVAQQFFDACETGKGWGVCRAWCTPNASFSAQAAPLADVRTLQGYVDWLKGLLTFMPDGGYAVKSFATDDGRNSVCAYGVFTATHAGQGGPCSPTGKSTTTDYVYVMDFDGDKIRHMTKIWNAGWAMKELGWV
jgi:SnoaL-like polyketide cyclase